MPAVGLHDWTAQYYAANESSCKAVLETAGCFDEIPSLNSVRLCDLRDGQVVKFRGMIQDMYDPEYYFERYEVTNNESGESRMENGMYMDSAKCSKEENESIDMDSTKNKISERHTCVVISIPGLNDWARDRSELRVRESEFTQSTVSKRELSGDEPMDCSEPVRKKANVSDSAPDASALPSQNCEKKTTLSKEHLMNFPIPNEEGRACIVKVYDENISYKLNDVLDIVGFVSLDPMLSRIHSSDETTNDAEIQTHNPPASLIPRLHAIKIVESTEDQGRKFQASELLSKAGSIRSELHMVLSQLLFGDELAADYLICHLISAVYMRKDHLCLGSFPLNITNFPIAKYKTFAKDLYQIIASLVPKSHYLECTLESLNDMSLIPKKDYECNRLTSGILQLSKNTHLVIDETGLTSGRVSATGRKNYEAISELMLFQKVTYDFKYFTMDYETDIPVLILSEVKSFIPCVTQVALKIDRESEDHYPQVVEAARQYLKDEERLAIIREYLRHIRYMEFEFGQEISGVIQEDFVKLRQTDKKFGADNLHGLMVLARLMSLSRGHDSLTPECWKTTVQMESRRAERLPQRNQ